MLVWGAGVFPQPSIFWSLLVTLQEGWYRFLMHIVRVRIFLHYGGRTVWQNKMSTLARKYRNCLREFLTAFCATVTYCIAHVTVRWLVTVNGGFLML
jgi:hypothetical protein